MRAREKLKDQYVHFVSIGTSELVTSLRTAGEIYYFTNVKKNYLVAGDSYLLFSKNSRSSSMSCLSSNISKFIGM
jgi:hypothetical protein